MANNLKNLQRSSIFLVYTPHTGSITAIIGKSPTTLWALSKFVSDNPLFHRCRTLLRLVIAADGFIALCGYIVGADAVAAGVCCSLVINPGGGDGWCSSNFVDHSCFVFFFFFGIFFCSVLVIVVIVVIMMVVVFSRNVNRRKTKGLHFCVATVPITSTTLWDVLVTTNISLLFFPSSSLQPN